MMNLIIEGKTATLYQGDEAILRVTTCDDELTAEVLDVNVIDGVYVAPLNTGIDLKPISELEEGYEPAPGIVVQREVEP